MNIEFNKYFNLSELPKEQQAAFINAVTSLVLAQMADMIGEHLSDEEISQLEALSVNGDNKEILEWLNEHVPNFKQGVEELLAAESADLAQKVEALTDYAVERA